MKVVDRALSSAPTGYRLILPTVTLLFLRTAGLAVRAAIAPDNSSQNHNGSVGAGAGFR